MGGCVGPTEKSLFPYRKSKRDPLIVHPLQGSNFTIKRMFWYTSWENCGILYPQKSVVLYIDYVCLKSDKLLRFISIKLSYSKPEMLFLLGVAGRRKRCMLGNNWSSTIFTFHHLLSQVGRAAISGISFRLHTRPHYILCRFVQEGVFYKAAQ